MFQPAPVGELFHSIIIINQGFDPSNQCNSEFLSLPDDLAELAVNIRNEGLIDCVLVEMPVEVPAVIRNGMLRGIPLNPYPSGFTHFYKTRLKQHP